MAFAHKTLVLAGAAGIILGALAVLGIRFFTYHEDHVHYHANFAVYLNGQREEFKSPFYYQEIGGGGCSAVTQTPLERVHMHDNVNDIVHVHGTAVTWGNFFENLRWAVTDTVIKTPQAVYVADDTHQITFILNGHEVQDISTETIHDRDRLLVDFGDTSNATLQKEAASVARTAVKYDTGKDPAACNAGSGTSFTDRLKHVF